MILSSAHLFAASSTGIGALGVDWKSLVIQLITFVLAFLVLRKWAFKPIIKILDQRRQLIEDGVKLGEKMRLDESALEAKIDQTLHQTRAQADQIISDANNTAKQLMRDAEGKAKSKAELILSEAKEKTSLELSRAKRQLESEMVNLVAQATSAVLDEKVDAQKDQGLIERSLALGKDN